MSGTTQVGALTRETGHLHQPVTTLRRDALTRNAGNSLASQRPWGLKPLGTSASVTGLLGVRVTRPAGDSSGLSWTCPNNSEQWPLVQAGKLAYGPRVVAFLLSLCVWLGGSNFEVQAAGSNARTRAFVESPPLLPDEPVLRDFAVRLQKTEQDLGWISETASASANRMLDHPGAVINVPYTEQQSFAEEILNRAGGLSSVLPPLWRPELLTPDDVILLSVRAWDEDGKSIEKLAKQARERGWRVVLFASRQGLPESFAVDDLVDNHARSGAGEEAAINSLTNALNVWTWVCEYAAALTRRGRYPGVLLSILAPGSAEHNQPLQTPRGRSFLGATTVAYAPGELGQIYHGRVERLLVDSNSSRRSLRSRGPRMLSQRPFGTAAA